MTEHLHIELHITVKDVLNPSILYIELQADVGNLVILRLKRNLGVQAACYCSLQHVGIIIAGVKGI